MTQVLLGERIALILKEQRLKNTEFAEALGVSANYVSLLLNGHKLNISVPLAKLVETTYSYRAEWLLTGEEPIRAGDVPCGLRENTVGRIMRMDDTGLRAVSEFIRTLDSARGGAAGAPSKTPPPVSADPGKRPLLTPAEHRVLDLFSQGMSARQASEALGLSLNTAKTHLRKIYKKFGIRTRNDLAGIMGKYKA